MICTNAILIVLNGTKMMQRVRKRTAVITCKNYHKVQLLGNKHALITSTFSGELNESLLRCPYFLEEYGVGNLQLKDIYNIVV